MKPSLLPHIFCWHLIRMPMGGLRLPHWRSVIIKFGGIKVAKETRTRNWSIIVYPESAPENWRSILDETHIEWVESPLHEFDKNADGQEKKPHYHVLLLFGGVKSYDQVKEFISDLNCPIPQRCHNARAMVRYFAHLDNPEKHQYSVSDIKGHGGVDIAELLKPASSERYTMIREMLSYVMDYKICEFYELMDYAMAEHFDDWFPLLCDNSAYIVHQYIKSNRQRYALVNYD